MTKCFSSTEFPSKAILVGIAFTEGCSVFKRSPEARIARGVFWRRANLALRGG